MQKVTFTFNGGQERSLSPRDAELLRRLGKGTYLTRDMRAVHAEPPASKAGAQEPKAKPESETGDDLDALDAQELHALAKERGIKVHHNAGADKVRAALRSAA